MKYMVNPNTIGDKLRNRRIELGLLQKEVAERFGVIEESITNWENGHSILQVRYYPKLIAFLEYYPFPEDNISVGGRIQKYRYINGLSHKAMGRLVGVDGSTICRWENWLTAKLPYKLKKHFSIIENKTFTK